jgi:hypothetical protein
MNGLSIEEYMELFRIFYSCKHGIEKQSIVLRTYRELLEIADMTHGKKEILDICMILYYVIGHVCVDPYPGYTKELGILKQFVRECETRWSLL